MHDLRALIFVRRQAADLQCRLRGQGNIYNLRGH
jgi:hypothetical protein